MYPVTPSIFRGPQPKNDLEFHFLHNIGIKTILDLENEFGEAAWERRQCEAAGIRFYSMRMSAFLTPDHGTVDAILALLATKEAWPLLVHCKQGVDRTGLVVALYRVKVQGWSKEKADEEMLHQGFHMPWCWLLRHYLWTH
jgi:tyrosine-protein phosphatase SIW14